ncbi:NAD(P)-dependent oxidoreductase [Sulfitobacter geojensis]|uniref:NAD(P)-dependent oxidoreductase n=1 Tax=Sulfitobacter geojensis TaxID=1342299 RepID=A0AAE2VWE3_9RHOB|nr:NAD(P)-dependent oxidoreductase [Sulfitobacter geojensis]MBM1688656.1 NAD(P)-dependent oxidoreductase [Sulfitobacter geojensis]MBM1692723.1 NAD(P)-dependent oxidoreductase [Sulfitobacter geojensis]MBM1704889.1 NAD(P)-dependent oxidoreductase [Sulfitobacter geojensis]MBM1708947.1 NAD(P)-dependent oxidoreductase [Sulfitobacter geojensis]MBM1713012.1 NAD(P)-dependent oxidoreductase [Sulfitobacter geojensis]
MTDTPTLGYIGTGLMGAPMSARLLDAGFALTVWNRTAAKAEPLVEKGAALGDNPSDVAAKSDIVFMCLTDTKAVQEAVFGENGVAQGARKGAVLVDFSSIQPEATREMSARLLAETGMAWIDAPVSGGVPGAEAGTLAIMAGGDAAAFAKVETVVLKMAAKFTLMGPSGAGQTTKLCNQVIVGCTMAVLAEAARLATNAGVDATRLPEALEGGFADSKPLQIFLPRMVNAQHEPPLGHVYTMLKDLDSVTDLARSCTSPVPFTAMAAEQFRLLSARGGNEADALEIFKLSGASAL